MVLSKTNLWRIVMLSVLAAGMLSCNTSHKVSSKKNKHRTEHVIKKPGKKSGAHKIGDIGSGTKEQRAIAKEALEWIGTPYRYASADKGEGTDCSGVSMKVYLDMTGKKLPRNSAKQEEYCKKIKRKDIAPGDLAFFATGKSPTKVSHVGIMINDHEFVHASTSKGVIVSDLEEPYWTRTFISFGRVP